MNSEIDDAIDALDDNLTGEEALKLINPNSLSARLVRRNRRYLMYRLRGAADRDETLPEGFIPDGLPEKYEEQVGFDGWKNFATTWDVALHDVETVVSRMFSEEEEWQRVVQAKFPQIKSDGSIKYPDMRVKEAIEAEAVVQRELAEAKEVEEAQAEEEVIEEKPSWKKSKKKR